MYVPTNGGITDRELLSANGDFFSRKEDLKLYNNQLNYIQTAYALGYSLGQIPSNLILSRARPRYWIPSLEVKTAVYDWESCWRTDTDFLFRRCVGPSSLSHCQDATMHINFTWFGCSLVWRPPSSQIISIHPCSIVDRTQAFVKVDTTPAFSTLLVHGIDEMNWGKELVYSRSAALWDKWRRGI